MTRFPTESRNVVGLEGGEYEPYKVGPVCAKPDCTKLTDHAHHLFSRAQMAGAFDWVRLPDGTETGNKVPLCWRDHRDVTENLVHITFDNGAFLWEGVPLSEQPPRKNGSGPVTTSQVEDGQVVERPTCTTCGQKLPRAKVERSFEDAKPRKTWAVSVPATQEENGADTLDALLEAAKDEMDKYGLDWGDGHKVKFHILSTALALFVQHSQQVLGPG